MTNLKFCHNKKQPNRCIWYSKNLKNYNEKKSLKELKYYTRKYSFNAKESSSLRTKRDVTCRRDGKRGILGLGEKVPFSLALSWSVGWARAFWPFEFIALSPVQHTGAIQDIFKSLFP